MGRFGRWRTAPRQLLYYSALLNLTRLQDQYDAYFFIVDLHSLTTHPNSADLRRNMIGVARDYVAAGLDLEKYTLYAQSSISDLTGELLCCPTFKEKAKKQPENNNYGLVGYPVLMAADILIHKGTFVPVGEDQLVHLAMARTIVRRFHQIYGDLFPEPQPLIENAVRIPAHSGQGKMSKSDARDPYISMRDENDQIQAKVKKAYSDPARFYKHQPGHTRICNIYHLHSFFTEADLLTDLATKCQQAAIGCADCKHHLATSLTSIVEPFRERPARLSEDYIVDILMVSGQKARASAELVLAEVRRAMGLRTF
ncbi:tryptophan--tRNA ligase [Tumebacillus algifaecis]|uniref:tryptophan--tRNA ligase n=1 Tax=Tumebacillus algifaecis TaxID=1214604 RepID=UPI001D1324F3|nr:tryptophan--tRNA ligase [Tumebacillus algifaecis]